MVIRNDNNAMNTNAFSYFPSTSQGGENDTFTGASLSIADRALVRFTRSLNMQSVSVETNALLDLNGCTLLVRRGVFTLCGVNQPSGTYAASNFVNGVIDSSVGQTGRVIIPARGGVFLIR